MRRSGCDRVALGLESVDQATLDGYHKSQTVDDIVHAIAALHAHGIRVSRHVRAGRRHRHREPPSRDTVDFALEARHRHADAQRAHAGARHASSSPRWRPRTASSTSAGSSTTASTWCSRRGRWRRPSCRREVLRGYARFYSLRRLLAHLVRLRFAARARLRLVLVVRAALALGAVQPRLSEEPRGTVQGRRWLAARHRAARRGGLTALWRPSRELAPLRRTSRSGESHAATADRDRLDPCGPVPAAVARHPV